MKTIEFPPLLAGPIVRRVEPTKLFIWVALSKPYQTKVELFRIESTSNNSNYRYMPISNHCKNEVIQLGDHLYINFIEILPQDGQFPTETLLGYNLLFERGRERHDLNSLGLLEPNHPNSIVYGNLNFPSFYINDDISSRILYGSCRKLHGKGEDSLASADHILQDTYAKMTERPSSLFMLGDQIYADDVPDPAFPIISQLSKALMGSRIEQLSQVDHHLKDDPFKAAIDQIQGRQYICEKFCKFTSTHASNHLLRFGEYATMYLLSWSQELWIIAQEKNLFQTFNQVIENDQLYFTFPTDDSFLKDRKKEFGQHQSRYNEQLNDMQQFISTLPQVRRVLANVPTYMIFDDHDITDDWNLTAEWKENVSNASLGSHVIANGLTAYWAFQGWGNAPQNFSNSFIQKMQTYLKTYDIESKSYKKWKNELLTYDSWHFMAPTFPQALFLDTRTQRAYDPLPQPERIGAIIEETNRGPILISDTAWKRISETVKQNNWRSKEPLIIASATPVYGIGLIETLLNQYVYPFRAVGVPVHTLFDFEAWKYNMKGFNKLLQWVSSWNPSYCVVISGDVHFADSVMSKVKFPNKKQLPIYQFTSSPLNNRSFDGVWGSLMKTAIWINSLKRKKNTIHRCCDHSFNVTEDTKDCDNAKDSYLWKEEISYLPMDNGSIIEPENNIGLLEFSATSIQNILCKGEASNPQLITYETILPDHNNSKQ